MSKIAVIPARGGSKRIPRKNIKIFAGRPIIAYSIEAAQKSELFDRIIVSTDDEEIASIAQGFGAEVPFLRPERLSDDFTGTNAVVRHALEFFMKQSLSVDYACCIYATTPFLHPKYLQEGFNKLTKEDKSFAFSVTTFASPIQRALRITQEGNVEAIWPENIPKRSQDLEEAFHDAGQFYWGTPKAFLNHVVIYSDASAPVLIPRHLVQDIDTPEDWKRAEYMYLALQLAEQDKNI